MSVSLNIVLLWTYIRKSSKIVEIISYSQVSFTIETTHRTDGIILLWNLWNLLINIPYNRRLFLRFYNTFTRKHQVSTYALSTTGGETTFPLTGIRHSRRLNNFWIIIIMSPFSLDPKFTNVRQIDRIILSLR